MYIETHYKKLFNKVPPKLSEALTGRGEANGQVAQYRRRAISQVVKGCGARVPAGPFLQSVVDCIKVSLPDVQEHQEQFQRLQSYTQGRLQASQPVEIDQQPISVLNLTLGSFLVGFLLGVLFMQPRG